MNHTKRQNSGHYIVKCGGKVKPGLYDSSETALYACEFGDEKIREVMSKYGVSVISMNMLNQVKQ